MQNKLPLRHNMHSRRPRIFDIFIDIKQLRSILNVIFIVKIHIYTGIFMNIFAHDVYT